MTGTVVRSKAILFREWFLQKWHRELKHENTIASSFKLSYEGNSALNDAKNLYADKIILQLLSFRAT